MIEFISIFVQAGGLTGLVVGLSLMFAWHKDRQYHEMINNYEDRLKFSYEQREIIYKRWLEKESKRSEKYWLLAKETNETIKEIVEVMGLDENNKF